MLAGSRLACRPWNSASACRSAKERIIHAVYIRLPFRSPSVYIERSCLLWLSPAEFSERSEQLAFSRATHHLSSEQFAAMTAAAAIDVATLLLHTGRESSTAAVSSGRKISEAEVVRARRDMVYAHHQMGWALDRLCELDGARWVHDTDQLGAIRRDVMTILTHHAASRQAAMAPFGRMLLARDHG
jgi:hypothetical protein